MAAGAWLFPDGVRLKLFQGQFLSSDSYKMALFQSTSNIGSSSTTYAGLTNEVANGNGYSTGGIAITLTISGTNPTVASPVAAITFPAGTGGSGTVTFFSVGKTGGGASDIYWSGTLTPNIVTGNGVTPQLTTASTIALD